jgi:S1-C subfamily serine protease
MLAQLTKNTKRLTGTAVLLLCLSTTSIARADDAALFTKTLQATGWIYVPGSGDGTCWVVDREQRLVITNKHVVGAQVDAEVMFPLFRDGQLVTAAREYLKLEDKLVIKGKVIARDAKRDLALVQLETLPENVGVLTLAETSAKLNDMVLSIGNSGLAGQPIEEGTLWKMRTGKVAQKSFRIVFYNNVQQKLETSLLNSTLRTASGDSGGPVVNAKGELVGVTSGGNGSDSFAVDVTEVREFVAKVMARGRRPVSSGRVVTGTWTQSWSNGNGQRDFAGVTLRPDGTVLFEDRNGACEGTYTLTDGRLTLVLPSLNREMNSEINWTNQDSFRVVRDGIEYTMQRR